MKGIRVRDGVPVFGEEPEPTGDGVEIRVVAASICASDLALVSGGLAEGRILGHEIAGTTADGRAFAIEPIASCRQCLWCEAGQPGHCIEGAGLIGIGLDGGMAERLVVPEHTLVPLPRGLDPASASLVEPIAVAVHAISRGRVSASDRVLVIGAGAIGLATVAALRSIGIVSDVAARHTHQAAAAERLGGRARIGDGYDVIVDSIGSDEAVGQAVALGRPGVRIVEVGMFWKPVALDIMACMKEAELITSTMYGGLAPEREMDRAAEIVGTEPSIAEVMITHRFPLDAASEGFAAAADRSSGTIKVVFEP